MSAHTKSCIFLQIQIERKDGPVRKQKRDPDQPSASLAAADLDSRQATLDPGSRS